MAALTQTSDSTLSERYPSFGKAFYFAFGSNMLTTRIQERIDSVQSLGRAILIDHGFSYSKLSIDYSKLSIDKSGKGNIHFEKGSSVEGVVFEVALTQFEKLDKCEGVPNHYQRTVKFVQLEDGKWVYAFTYVANSKKINTTLKPTKEYLDLVVNGALEHKLSAKYISSCLETQTLES